MSNDSEYLAQIVLAKRLLRTARHAAYATVNEDGTQHSLIVSGARVDAQTLLKEQEQ